MYIINRGLHCVMAAVIQGRDLKHRRKEIRAFPLNYSPSTNWIHEKSCPLVRDRSP